MLSIIEELLINVSFFGLISSCIHERSGRRNYKAEVNSSHNILIIVIIKHGHPKLDGPSINNNRTLNRKPYVILGI